MRQRI
jgi:hypothetical protein